MQQQQQQRNASDAPAEVLQLLLQQPGMCSIHNSSVVCKLLATSNATRTAVASTIGGRLCLAYTSTDSRKSGLDPVNLQGPLRGSNEKSFAAWLATHGHLLELLYVGGTRGDFGLHLATALRTADVASPNGLRLRSFGSEWPAANTAEVLQQLPAHLSNLNLCITERFEPEEPFEEVEGDMDMECECGMWDVDDDEEGYGWGFYGGWDGGVCEQCRAGYKEGYEDYQRMEREKILNSRDNASMATALARLTNLRALSIHGHETLLPNSPVICGLSQLTALTKLSIASVLPDHSLLSHLPPQLRELEVDGVNRKTCKTPLALGHLTALTRMHLSAVATHVSVGGKDVLPPNLVSLCVSKIDGPLQLLIDVKSLRKLTLAQLPLLNQLPGHTTATSTHGRGRSASNSGATAEATPEQVQACLPDVAITLSLGCCGNEFMCHCRSDTVS